MFAPYRNPFAFPVGVRPSVDPSHLATGTTLCYSGIAAPGGGFINLLSGSKASKQSSPTTVQTAIGPALNADTTTGWCTDGSINPTVTTCTIAAILIPVTSVATGRIFIMTDTNTTVNISGIELPSLVLNFRTQGSAYSSGITLSLNTPYFVAGSFRSGNQNWVVVNLKTGQIQTAANTTSLTMDSPSAPYAIGGNFSSARAAGAQIAAVMFSANRFLRPAQLLKWAQDPWAFWYPEVAQESDPLDFLSGSATVNGTIAATLDALTLSAAATAPVAGTIAATFDALTLSVAATAPVKATIAATLDALQFAATAHDPVAATVAVSLDALTLSSAAVAPVKGTIAATLDALVLDASAVAPVKATIAATLDDLFATAAAVAPVTAVLDVTLDALVFAAAGNVVTVVETPAERTVTLAAEVRSVAVAAETRSAAVAAETRAVSVAAEARLATVAAETRSATIAAENRIAIA